ncbi:MAG TPA: aminotransferase class III-fold pyridoxal phosphate-dependent enzyme [Gemmatimonadales bacterium]|nr:aminotransferase class III-fold pyridoxal phosphate-dependent enzyme [Gemmatimonadales bacterium]
MTGMSVFEHHRPAFPEREVQALLLRDFGLRGELSPLVSERDQNLRVVTETGTYVLKIGNAREDAQVLALQDAVLDHLAVTAPSLGVPRVIRTPSGQSCVIWEHAGGRHLVRVLSYLPGRLYSGVESSPALLRSLGACAGRLSRALQGFGHPAAHRPGFLWNLDEVLAREPWVADIADPAHRTMLQRHFARYRSRVLPHLASLRGAVVHQDLNDHNLLVDELGATVTGMIDFGDLTFGRQVNELAVVLAYALMDVDDLAASACEVIAGYVSAFSLEVRELEVLFDLVAMRLASSVCISSHRAARFPDNAYLSISQAPALRLLERLDQCNPAMLAAVARHAAGLPAVADHETIVRWLEDDAPEARPLFDFDLQRACRMAVSLVDGAPGMEHGADPDAYWHWLRERMADVGAIMAIGNYGERRDVYTTAQFRDPLCAEPRSQHLGLDLFVPVGTPLHAPYPGTVVSVVDNAIPLDYGPTVILAHHTGEGGPVFHTLYGHLARESLDLLTVGERVEAGQRIGSIGSAAVNGGWAPHLHFQIITDLLGLVGNFPGVGHPSLWPVWRQIAPDPNLVLGLAPESFTVDPAPPAALLGRRERVIGPSLSTSYRHKLKMVRGEGTWLFDHTGRGYLDCVNNICHVGHAHPHVVEALSRQAAILNTNTRYLHDTLIEYAERLGGTFPDPLSVVYMVCSGSEANELALRMARTVTGQRDVITLDWGYHGHTAACIEVSPYKFNRAGGQGRAAHVQVATLPDPYRGRWRGTGAAAAHSYADAIDDCLAAIEARTGGGAAAFIAEAISGCGGQVMYPEGYLGEAACRVRSAGGLMIVDEVQTGFGRVGSHFWAHELQGVVPDIVTIGKPIGNGHPMAAVITTPAIAAAFANGMEFFSSFGGNPVSAAVGMAVLDVIEDEELQARAGWTGAHLLRRLRDLADRHEVIGDVRGAGLFLGVDLVSDRTTRTPATDEARRVVNAMREAGILLSTDGPADNVIKIKPPMVFGMAEADLLVETLDAVLGRA